MTNLPSILSAFLSPSPQPLRSRLLPFALFAAIVFVSAPTHAQVAIRAESLMTMGPQGTIKDGVILIDAAGKITAVGPAATTAIPDGYKVHSARIVTPGLIDTHCTVGVSGIFNTKADSDQLERSSPMQPELRAIDAYNPAEPLIEWVRSFGVTTIHTGHAPGELISGQTMVAKTTGKTSEKAAIVPSAMLAVTFSPSAQRDGGKSPGTRGKMMAMLRQDLIKAREYAAKRATAEKNPAAADKDDDKHEDKPGATDSSKKEHKNPGRDLHMETLVRVLNKDLPVLVTAHRAQDIASVLRLKAEFDIRVVLDGASEAYLLIDEIKAAGVPVIVHPSMMRATGEADNAAFTTASKLMAAGILTASQGGYEGYVPKARVVLFEAAITASNGLTQQQALATITIDAAKLLGVDKRIGSLEVGKDGDAAMYDGDPLEYTTHCIGVFIEGKQVSTETR